MERRPFYEPDAVLTAVRDLLKNVGEPVDYLSFVPDGEPTLDANLGRTIEQLRTLGIPIAIISNASLVWRPDVCEDLGMADWVSLKIDSVDEKIWKRIDRPNHHLDFQSVMKGVRDFAQIYTGELVTETMLVEGINDDADSLERVARFIASINPRKAYLSIPIRPPTDNRVHSPDEETVTRAYRTFSRFLPNVECLTGHEGEDFGHTGNFEQDLLNITAVHPLRQEAVQELCKHDGADWDCLEAMIHNKKLARVNYAGETYYTRKWDHR